MRKKEEDRISTLFKTTGSVLIGGMLALCICIIILLLCSVGISNGWLNDRSFIQYAITGCLIGGFCGSTCSVAIVRSKTLIIGFLTSCVQLILILSIGFLIYSDITLSEHGASIAVGCLAGGLLGGFLCGKPKKKRRK